MAWNGILPLACVKKMVLLSPSTSKEPGMFTL